MKRFTKQNKGKLRAGLLLLVIYSMHLFVFQALLANPTENLCKYSFGKDKTTTAKCTDCLILLAKKDQAKTFSTRHAIVATMPSDHPPVYYRLPLKANFEPLPLTSSRKRYRLLRVFLI